MKTSVVVSRCPHYSDQALAQSIEEIFSHDPTYIDTIFKNKKVLLKPNLIMAEPAAHATVTHPQLLAVLIDILQAKGARVSIGDSPAFGSAQGVSNACGLSLIAKRMNVPIISFKGNKNIYRKETQKSILNALPKALKNKIASLSTISRTALDFDTIVNLPKLKAHVQMGLSSATKNLYGFISGKAKVFRHFRVDNDVELFSLFILHILERVQPEFTIVDAVETLERHGPRHGDVTERGLLIGGRESLAVDRVVTELIGCDLVEHPIVAFATKYNSPFVHPDDIDIINRENCDLKGFVLCEKTLPISFSLPRVLKSMIRHAIVQFSEKK